MKICYVHHSYYPGNVPFYVHTQELARLGAEVYAMALRREGEPPEERVGQVWVMRVLDYSRSLGSAYLRFSRFLSSAYRTLQRLDRLDIVHMRNLPGVSLFPLLARSRARAWVLGIYSPPLHPKLRSWFSNLRIRAEARAFDVTLVHRQAVGEAIFGHSASRFVENPIGVDFDHFRPGRNIVLRQKLGVSSEETLLIYTGSVQPKRTLHKMLAGFAQANASLAHLHLVIVGDGTDLPRLRALADDMDITERVHFQGYVPYARMPAYMQAADIGLCYVPVTPWYDKAPVLKTMESMASGLPTIATATQGNRAYIKNEENGLLVEDSPDDLAAAIVRLCHCDALRHRCAENGRDSIRAYDWHRIVEDILLPTYIELSGQRQGLSR